jgi:hypothetical protein
MSRRHHGGRPHRGGGHGRPFEASHGPAFAAPDRTGSVESPPSLREPVVEHPVTIVEPPAPLTATHHEGSNGLGGGAILPQNGAASNGLSSEPGNGPAPSHAAIDGDHAAACTAPQLRRFIKSRPYVPMHELRRRFGINGGEDDVTPVDLGSGRVFVGLPQREGALLGELLRGGEIGYELSLDPRSPVVVGLYPMRPVART